VGVVGVGWAWIWFGFDVFESKEWDWRELGWRLDVEMKVEFSKQY
jgi:hypothetical protein